MERRGDASESILTMLVWAVGSVLATRLWFTVTGNPKIAFGGWHIAHVLFGGMAMLSALIVLLVFSGLRARRIGTIVGGIGWGLFIDEIGKFLTRDNNYWFRPAIIFIYISFMSLFLLSRRLGRNERDGGLNLGIIRLISRLMKATYNRVFRRRLTMFILAAYSLYYSVDKIVDFVKIIISQEKVGAIEYFYRTYDLFSRSDVYMIWGKIGIDILTAALLLSGWYWVLRGRRMVGLGYFRLGLLANVLIGSVFKFYFEQFSGVFSFGAGVVTYELLGSLLREKGRNREAMKEFPLVSSTLFFNR